MNKVSGIYALLLIVMLSAVGCGYDTKQRAEELDHRIGSINDTLLLHGKEWGDELRVAVNTLDFSQLEGVRMKMQHYIEEKIEEVDDIKHVGGSEDLVAKELEFLKMEHDIVKNKFSAFEQFDTTVSMEQLTEAYAKVQISGEKEGEVLEELHKLREEYADENGFPKYIDKY